MMKVIIKRFLTFLSLTHLSASQTFPFALNKHFPLQEEEGALELSFQEKGAQSILNSLTCRLT